MIRSRSMAAVAVTGVVVAAGLLAAHAVSAQPRGRGFGGPGRGFAGGFGGPPLLLRQLDLTAEQREQVRTIFEQQREELRAAGERLRAAEQGRQEAITAVPYDEQAIRNSSNEIAAAMTDLAIVEARIHSQIHALLTPEQQAKADELRAERQKRMEERHRRMLERRQRLEERGRR